MTVVDWWKTARDAALRIDCMNGVQWNFLRSEGKPLRDTVHNPIARNSEQSIRIIPTACSQIPHN
jgi:hypothetical protein